MEKNNTFTQGKILMTLTNLVSSFAMGTTVLLGQQIGCGERKQGGRTVGTAIVMFTVIALVMTAVLVIFAPQVSSIMNAPEEAFDKTVAYPVFKHRWPRTYFRGYTRSGLRSDGLRMDRDRLYFHGDRRFQNAAVCGCRCMCIQYCRGSDPLCGI